MDLASPMQTPDSNSERVERLVAEGIERVLTEGHHAIEAICAANPDCAEEVRASFRSLERTGLFDVATPDPLGHPDRLGEYRLVRRIGGGGMGLVFEAVQESLGRRVALKLIRPDQLWFEGTRERFRREVETIARLHHPAIVPIHTVGEEGGVPFFAMELIEGATLGEVLDALGDRDPSELRASDLLGALPGTDDGRDPPEHFRGSWIDACLHIARTVADALDYAHARGVTHRDIKPSNIMLTRLGRVVVLDFGLASSGNAERLTRSGARLGSLAYMSPQQVEGDAEQVGPQSDVYSLGVTLYELLALRAPFLAPTTEATIRRVLDNRPEPLRRRNARASRDVETVCTTAIRAEPARRYGTAAMFARDLEHLLAGRAIEAVPPGPWDRLRSVVRRYKLATSLAGALFVSLVAFAGMMLVLTQRAEGKARTAERVSEFLERLVMGIDPVEGSDAPSPGNVLVSRSILDRQLSSVLEDLVDEPQSQLRLLHSFCRAYLNLEMPKRALVAAEHAVAIAARSSGRTSEAYLGALWTVMTSNDRLGRFAERERGAREALAVARELHGDDPIRLAPWIRTLASARATRGDLREGRVLLDASIRDLRAAAGRGDADYELQRSLRTLGSIVQNTDPEASETLFRTAVEILERLDRPEQSAVARLALAGGLTLRGKIPEAKELALEVLRDCQAGRGGVRSEIAALSAIGNIESAARDLAAARVWAGRAHALARSRFGAGHPLTVGPLIRVADMHRATGDLATAERLLEERLALQRQFDPDPLARSTLQLQMRLGTVASIRRDDVRSVRLLETAAKGLAAVGTPELAYQARRALAASYNRLNDTAAATREYRALLATDLAPLQRISCLVQLSGLLRRRSRFTAAATALREVVELRRRLGGSQTLEFGKALRMLAGAEARVDVRRATATMRRALALARAHGGPLDVASALVAASDIAFKSGDDAAALRDAREAVAIVERERGATHAMTGLYQARLASLAVSCGDDSATAALDRAVRIADGHPDHPTTSSALWLVGLAHRRLRDHASARRFFERVAVEQPGSAHLALVFACQAIEDMPAARTNLMIELSRHRRGPSYPDGEHGYALLEAALGQGDPELLASVGGDVARKAELHLALPADDDRHPASLLEVATLAIAYGALDVAETLLRRAKALFIQHGEPGSTIAWLIDAELGWCLCRAERFPEAERLLRASAAGLEAFYHGTGHWRVRRTIERLAQLFERTGRPEEARAWTNRIRRTR